MINNLRLLTQAYHFSAKKHMYQRRKGVSDIPYINHPIQVANILAQSTNSDDVSLICAAILHDTLEDTETTKEELAEVFGDEILQLVLEVTDNMLLPKEIRKKEQIKNAPLLSANAKKIKIADKICNVLDIIQTRFHWTNKQKHDYINWSIEVVNGCKGVDLTLEKEFDKALMMASSLIGWKKPTD